MSVGSEPPGPYGLSVTERVRERLLELAAAAEARGDGRSFRAALREFDRRLRLYPQFGDPLIDLTHKDGQVRLGAVPPLAMRYVVLEAQRVVFLTALPVLMPMPRGPAPRG